MKFSLLMAFILAPGAAFAAEYLVKYRTPSAYAMAIGQSGMSPLPFEVKDISNEGRYTVVEIPDDQSAKILTNKNVEWVNPNINFEATKSTSPVLQNLRPQWSLDKVHAPAAWRKAGRRGSREVTIGVLDTGVDYRHKNLIHNMVPGFNFVNDNGDADDITKYLNNVGHGTHCAGIIAADGSIKGGVSGVAPEASLMPLRFLNENGNGDLNHAIKAIDFAIQHRVQVLSASWNKKIPKASVQGLIEAMQRGEAAGIIFVLTADNDGLSNDVSEIYPANVNLPNSITVTSSDLNDQRPTRANFGRANVHIAAPGEQIVSTLPKDLYGTMSGTSAATPLVAGSIALLKAEDKDLTGAEIRALLQVSGAPVNIETACHCRLDIASAMSMLVDKKPWLVPAAGTLKVRDTLKLKMKNGREPIQYQSTNSKVLTVFNGIVTGVGIGTARVSAMDADGVTVSSLDLNVIAGPAPCKATNPLFCAKINY